MLSYLINKIKRKNEDEVKLKSAAELSQDWEQERAMLGSQGQDSSDKFSHLRPIENPNKRNKLAPLKDEGDYDSEDDNDG